MGPSNQSLEAAGASGVSRASKGQLALWQWVVLALPVVSIVGFVIVAAGVQIHAWGISWIWAIMTLVFVGWRWLVVKWTQPLLKQLSGAIVDLETELDSTLAERSEMASDAEIVKQADEAIRTILENAQDDLPIWEDWPTFWQRCQEVVSAIAHLYHPEVKYPLLNIHIPQAYGLIRGTVDDMDVWMQKLSPVLNHVSVGQAYQAYEVYRKIEPSARKLGKVWNWARWLWNPAAAAAQTVSQPYNNQATQQLLVNLSQSLREVALHTLGQQAIALYSGKVSNPSQSSGDLLDGQTGMRSGSTPSPSGAIPIPSTSLSSEQVTWQDLPSTVADDSPPFNKTQPSKTLPDNKAQPDPSLLDKTLTNPSSSVGKGSAPSVPVQVLPPPVSASQTIPNTETIRALLDRVKSPGQVDQEPVKILLVGRTGAGKSSVINTLFKTDKAAVDVLPSTDRIQSYEWHSVRSSVDALERSPVDASGSSLAHQQRLDKTTQLILWDSPGYEQTDQTEFREQVLTQAQRADVVVLVTPAMDPALQMDVDFLSDLKQEAPELPVFVVVTQVDRVRPVRQWNPPYDWQQGTSAKETAIRDAIAYRQDSLGDICDQVLPLVTLEMGSNGTPKRPSWNGEILVENMIGAIAPAKQIRLARFLKTQTLQAHAAAQIIRNYTVQMTTTQGLAAFLKSPILKFISTLTTGSPDLAYVLEEQIPVEQLPLVIGKLQMAYDLFNALSNQDDASFNLRSLWPLLLENKGGPRQNATLFGYVVSEHFIQNTSTETLHHHFYRQIDQLA